VIAPSRSLSIISKETRDIANKRFEELGLILSFGKNVEINDEFRALKNIDSAIKSGLLEVVSYDSRADSGVAQEEVNEGSVTEHSQLIDDQPEKHMLIDDNVESLIGLWSSEKIAEEIEKLLSKFNPKVITADYEAQTAEHILCNTAISLVVTLPESSSDTEGKLIIIKNINIGLVSIDGYGDEKIDNDSTVYLSSIWESVILINSGTKWYIALKDVGGDDWSSDST
jgi:hypothetical protein